MESMTIETTERQSHLEAHEDREPRRPTRAECVAIVRDLRDGIGIRDADPHAWDAKCTAVMAGMMIGPHDGGAGFVRFTHPQEDSPRPLHGLIRYNRSAPEAEQQRQVARVLAMWLVEYDGYLSSDDNVELVANLITAEHFPVA